MSHAASAALLLLALGGGALVATALPGVDGTRQARTIDQALLFVPDGEQVRLVATGFEEPLADLFWVRTVLMFGERYDTERGGTWTEWLRRMIRAVNTLDPTWRTAYFYGGTILRVTGEIDGSNQVFEEARRNIPTDPFFPFSLGMNAYLYDEDPDAAARLLAEAAALPGAPSWYAAAAAAMHQTGGQRATGIRFLEEVRATTSDPAIRGDAERQLGRLRHNALVDTWTDACRRYRDETGHALASPAALTGLGIDLPENPRGDPWVIGADGVVRGADAEAERYRRALQGELRLLGR
ncbi:MAG: hypothetical protein Q8P41_06190 [Pseudomonadota bacterium]|nr:hypothetical protein [Pseudomonadota bacterium]